MNITAEQAAEINGRLSTGEVIFEYVRKAPTTRSTPDKEGKKTLARGVPYGVLVAGKSKSGRIFISGSIRHNKDPHDALELKRIALARLDKAIVRYEAARTGMIAYDNIQPLLPASLEEHALKFAERAVIYFEGCGLERPVFKDFTNVKDRKMDEEISKMIEQAPLLTKEDLEELGDGVRETVRDVTAAEEREFIQSLPKVLNIT